jgi:dihydroorotate dehydrogenase (NAD+) catalytic subunit
MSQTTTPGCPVQTRPSLQVDLAGLSLDNPMMTASGTCGYGYEYADFADISKLGAFVTKSVTAQPRKGNDAYRIVETRGGMLNAIGLANVGLDAFMRDKLPPLRELRKAGPKIIVNVAGYSTEDYVHTAGTIAQQDDVDAIELNVSCPNVKDGLTFGTDGPMLKKLVAEVKNAIGNRCKLIVKLSPNVADITVTARAAVEGGADILSLINTYTAMVVDIEKRRPRLANGTGGLSGPAVRPLAVYLVHRVYRNVAKPAGIPIIGMGGIQYWQDAIEFLLAGATGLAVGTALFVDPATPLKVAQGIEAYLARHGCSSINDIIGTLKMPGEA